MDYLSELGNVNIIAVLCATFVSLVLGFIWYNMNVFGARWAKLAGIKKKDLDKPKGIGLNMLIMSIGAFVAASVIAVIMQATDMDTGLDGFTLGFLFGLAFRLSSHFMHNAFVGRNHELSVIDGMHDTLQLALMGLVIGLWL
ncbi:DUF1761 domain-containing protein [Candidatus Saccharibacteria bacterium]|nr:DUF1761 domain-containing protein [Candidatus Saccharibacteria bacterium]MCB9821165.1 DUF1761 domain-containing protein [Candidatus Nomurabacteria bacterium]